MKHSKREGSSKNSSRRMNSYDSSSELMMMKSGRHFKNASERKIQRKRNSNQKLDKYMCGPATVPCSKAQSKGTSIPKSIVPIKLTKFRRSVVSLVRKVFLDRKSTRLN